MIRVLCQTDSAGVLQVLAISRHMHEVYSAAFSPDGKSVVSGAANTYVQIWNAETGAKVRWCLVLISAERNFCPCFSRGRSMLLRVIRGWCGGCIVGVPRDEALLPT